MERTGTPSTTQGDAAPKGPLVLIVDDDPDFAHLLQRRLTIAGYRTELSESALGLSARLLKEPTVDVVLLDCMMPALTGPAVLAILARNPRLMSIPIVLMSALPDFRTAVANHANATFVEKSGHLQELVTVLQALLPVSPRPEP